MDCIRDGDNEPPEVTIEYPPDGATFTEPDITVTGVMTDNVGIVSIGSHHEWEGGEEWTSGTVDPPVTYYPFEWDFELREGWNKITITGVDPTRNEGEDSVTVTYVTEDTIPPTTTKIVGEPKYGETALYVTSHTPITLMAQDNESGVNYTLYRIWYNASWTDWLKYTESFTLEGEGPHYIEFYSVDTAGNIEEVHNQTHIVDDTPPYTYPYKYPLWAWYIPDKWALICASDDDEDGRFISNALQAYYALKNHGYDDEHIILILCHNTQNIVHLDDLKVNILFGPDGKKGTRDDPIIDYDIPLSWPLNVFGMKASLALGMWELSQKVKENDEVLIYLRNHGSLDAQHWTYFCFEDGSRVREDVFAKWLDMIKCHKLVFVGDFCHSGCFIDESHSSAPDRINGMNKPKRILISACDCGTGNSFSFMDEPPKPPLPGDFCGSFFGYPFWKALNAGKSYKDAFENAKAFIPPTYAKSVDEMQHPQMGDRNGNADWNSPTDWENVLPGYGWIDFHPWESGGISYGKPTVNISDEDEVAPKGEDNRRGEPVGVKATYYRIWHNGEWTSWQEFTENITFEDEGKYYVEWYSEDYLGNREDVTNHTIYVDASPPSITPTPSYPPDGGETDNVPTFNWSASEDPSDVSYTLQVATDESFVNIVFQEENISCPHYTMSSGDALGKGTYYWRVRATDGLGHSGDWSTSWSFTVVRENSPPEKPSRPSGPNRVEVGVEYNLSTVISDVDEDEMIVWFDWGDGTYDLAFGYYKSGDTVTMSHSWEEKGTYSVRVKTVDIHGAESEWSDPLPIIVPYSMNVSIEEPEQDYLYIFGKKIIPLRGTHHTHGSGMNLQWGDIQ